MIQLADHNLSGILNQTSKMLEKHFAKLAALAAIYVVPTHIPLLYWFNRTIEKMEYGYGGASQEEIILTMLQHVAIVGLVTMAVILATTSAVSIAVGRAYTEGHIDIKEAVLTGLKRMPALVLTAILLYLLMLAGFTIGAILLFVPGFIVIARLSIAPTASVLEEIGPISAIKRAWYLTKGRAMRYLGLMLLLGLLNAGISSLAELIENPMMNAVAVTLITVFTTVLITTATVVYYYSQRVHKDGLDVELLTGELDRVSTGHDSTHFPPPPPPPPSSGTIPGPGTGQSSESSSLYTPKF